MEARRGCSGWLDGTGLVEAQLRGAPATHAMGDCRSEVVSRTMRMSLCLGGWTVTCLCAQESAGYHILRPRPLLRWHCHGCKSQIFLQKECSTSTHTPGVLARWYLGKPVRSLASRYHHSCAPAETGFGSSATPVKLFWQWPTINSSPQEAEI